MTDTAPRVELGEIEQFNKSNLNQASTTVRCGMVDGYVQEKAIEQVGNFPKEQLNHVDTDVKCPLPTLSDIELEKQTSF